MKLIIKVIAKKFLNLVMKYLQLKIIKRRFKMLQFQKTFSNKIIL